MEEANQETTEEVVNEESTEETPQETNETAEHQEYQIENVEEIVPNVIVDLMRTNETIVTTGRGKINVIHEITLGDVAISILLTCILIFMVLNRFIRR